MKPLHTCNLKGKPVRFYPSPRDIPDAPWVAAYDLLDAVDIPADVQPLFRETTLSDRDATRMIREDGGAIVSIVAHAVAYGLIQAAIEKGYAPKSLDAGYREEAVYALNAAAKGKPESWRWTALGTALGGDGR